MKTNFRLLVHLICLLPSGLLASCARPDYARPAMRMPANWLAPLPHGGKMEQMTDWWKQFKDPVLTELQQAGENDSPTLDKAVAAIKSARASVTTSRASGIPSLSASANATRSGDFGTHSSANTTTSSGIDASWEIPSLSVYAAASNPPRPQWQRKWPIGTTPASAWLPK